MTSKLFNIDFALVVFASGDFRELPGHQECFGDVRGSEILNLDLKLSSYSSNIRVITRDATASSKGT